MGKNYKKVQQLVENQQLELISIISPARTGSTIASKVMTSHPNVQKESTQPFRIEDTEDMSQLPKDREEEAYGRILKSYDIAKERSEDKDSPIKMVVKEMSRNMATDGQLERWDDVSSKQMTTLRHPLLAAESLLGLTMSSFYEEKKPAFHDLAKEHAEKNGHEVTEEYLDKFLNVYAKDKGYVDETGNGKHFDVMKKDIKKKRDYTPLEELFPEFAKYDDLNAQLPEMQAHFTKQLTDEQAKKVGYESLDDFAKDKGKESWQEVKDEALESQDFSTAAPLLNEIYKNSISGWFNTGVIMGQLEDPVMLEMSIICADNSTVDKACSATGLSTGHIDEMVSFEGYGPKSTESDDMGDNYKAAFNVAMNSEKLAAPNRSPLPLSALPESVKEHVMDTAFPVYLDLISRDKDIRPQSKEELEALLDTQLDVKGESQKKSFQDVDPVLAYSLISTDSSLSTEERDAMQTKVRHSHDDKYGDVFDRIEEIGTQLRTDKVKQRQEEIKEIGNEAFRRHRVPSIAREEESYVKRVGSDVEKPVEAEQSLAAKYAPKTLSGGYAEARTQQKQDAAQLHVV